MHGGFPGLSDYYREISNFQWTLLYLFGFTAYLRDITQNMTTPGITITSHHCRHSNIIALFARLQVLQFCITFLQYGIRVLWLYIQNCVRSFLTVNCCKTKKLLPVQYSRAVALEVLQNLQLSTVLQVTYLRFLDALFGTVYW